MSRDHDPSLENHNPASGQLSLTGFWKFYCKFFMPCKILSIGGQDSEKVPEFQIAKISYYTGPLLCTNDYYRLAHTAAGKFLHNCMN